MVLLTLLSPNLTSISSGVPNLLLLEAAGYSDDGRLLLVKAVFTDLTNLQRQGFWLYDLATRSYVQNLTAQWLATNPSPAGMSIVEASLIGPSDQYLVVAKASTTGLEPEDRLVSFDATGVVSADVLAEWFGPDAAPRIERFAASPDGRFLALQTDASNLLPVGQLDTNEVSDILLLDRLTRDVTRVSMVGNAELEHAVHLGSLRVDGDRVEIAFVSTDAFVTSDRNGSASIEADRQDAYLWTSSFGASGLVGAPTFTLVSRRPDGSAAGGVATDSPVLTTDGGVYFSSTAAELVSNDTNGAPDVFRALASANGQIGVERIALANTPEFASGAKLLDASASGDRIALLTDDEAVSAQKGLFQAIIVEWPSGSWQLASRTASGSPGDDDGVFSGRLSTTSKALAFTSAASNLAAYDPVASLGSLYVAIFNSPPTVAHEIGDQEAVQDTVFTFTLPLQTFADIDVGDDLTYTVGLAAGTTLPDWLIFDSAARRFSGTPSNADVGTENILVTATDPSGGSVSANFQLTVFNVDDEAIGTLDVFDTAEEGGSLTAALSGVWDADGTTTTAYHWQELVNSTWTDLGGATSATLAIPDDQSFVGKLVRVVATTTDVLGGTTDFEGTAQTIANVDDEATGTIQVMGAAIIGSLLSATVANLLDADGPVTSTSWQWQLGAAEIDGVTTWTDIPGATQSDFAIPTSDDILGSAIRVVVTTVDLTGGSTVLISDQAGPVEGLQANITAKFWASEKPISGVAIQTGDEANQTQTSADGQGTLQGITSSSQTLSAQKAVTAAEETTASQAVTLQDAMSILKMIAGQATSAGSPPVSRFQSLAADFDGSGTVSLADALGVLRHSVGLQAPKPAWVFAEEGDDALSSILIPGIPGPVTVDVSPPGPIEVSLIGILRGDVDGSWDPHRYGVSGEI